VFLVFLIISTFEAIAYHELINQSIPPDCLYIVILLTCQAYVKSSLSYKIDIFNLHVINMYIKKNTKLCCTVFIIILYT
jgi:hypothetical protein